MKKIIAINLSTSENKIGGAAIAAKFQSIYTSKNIEGIELWRMWNKNGVKIEKGLKIRNFKSIFFIEKFRKILPKRLVSTFLRSNIVKELKKEKPCIVHIHNVLPSFEFYRIVKFCKRSGIFIIVSTHGFYEVFNPNHNFNFLEQLLWKIIVKIPIKKSLYLVDKIITSYPDEKIFLNSINIKSSNISIIPNGINPIYEKASSKKDIELTVEKYKINTSNPILFFTGNHTPNKGIDTVFKIARKLKINSTIVVGGRLLNDNEPLFYLKNFKSKYVTIIFTDYLTEKEQRAFYDISTLLLFPSKSDTSPLTIIESMARGLPVVAFNVGGIKYLLDNDSGFLINNLSFNEYYNCVKDNIKNLSKLNIKSRNAKSRQKELFNWKRSALKTSKVYKNLLKISKSENRYYFID